MNTFQELFNIIPTLRIDHVTYKYQLKHAILLPNNDIFKTFKLLRLLNETVSELLKDSEIKNKLVECARGQLKKTFELHETKFQLRESIKYDFDICEDSELNNLKKEHQELKNKLIKVQDSIKDELNQIMLSVEYCNDKIKGRELVLKKIPDDGLVDSNKTIKPPKKTKSAMVTVKVL
jgi:hypothetical protein